MAIQGKGILDGPRGSLADITGYKSNGKSIIKTKNKRSAKTQTPALIKSQENFKFCMRVYQRLRTSNWAPYLNYSLPGKSLMNHILSLTNILNQDENLLLPDANLFGKKDYNSKFELFQNVTTAPYSIKITTLNAPQTPEALPDDRYFQLTWNGPIDTLSVINSLELYRGTLEEFNYSQTFFTMAPGTYWVFNAFFSNDFSKIFQQAFIKTIIP